MEEKLSRCLREAALKMDPSLSLKIWQKLVLRNKKMAEIKLAVFSALGTISAISIIPAFNSLSSRLSQSGIYEYLSIAFSGNNFSAVWRELFYSIAESLPTLSITLSLSIIFVFFISIKYAMKQIISGQLLNRQIKSV